ncbi:MAG: DNA-3-methyladenine glycosylase I [Pseudomonadota bacterium]
MTSYCEMAPGHEFHGPYHDHEYGVPVTDEAILFERLVLEINQAGLSWLTILNKRAGFQKAYEGFVVDKVAAYDDAHRTRLLHDASIIRNRLKIDATMHNARIVQGFRDRYGGFYAWLMYHHPMRKPEWVKLFKKTFRFTGGEITGEFLMSTGFLPGAHDVTCAVGKAITGAPWQELGSVWFDDKGDGV